MGSMQESTLSKPTEEQQEEEGRGERERRVKRKQRGGGREGEREASRWGQSQALPGLSYHGSGVGAVPWG